MSSSILNLFLLGMECQELAPVLSRVDLALQYRKDWPTPITTRDFRNSLAMLTLGGAGYGYSTLNQDIHGNFSTYIECQTVLQRARMIALINVGCVLMIMSQYITSTPVIRIFLNKRVPKIAGKTIPSNK